MNWSYKLGTSAIDALTANYAGLPACRFHHGRLRRRLPGRHHGWHQIDLQIPTAPPWPLPTTVMVSRKEAENFNRVEGIDTETAGEAGTIAMTVEGRQRPHCRGRRRRCQVAVSSIG